MSVTEMITINGNPRPEEVAATIAVLKTLRAKNTASETTHDSAWGAVWRRPGRPETAGAGWQAVYRN